MNAIATGGHGAIKELGSAELEMVGGAVDSADLETLSLAAGAVAAVASVTPIPGARFVAAGAAVVTVGAYLTAQIID
ncbi:hypothetical protein Q9K02_14205 [Qipengyuania sp. G39]|uniref:Bacteriocin n=1 Tax=Qipengyuania profundimaris TaxID=3067652 RepID=A0ABT9HTD7_9SPHN|nr:hypothetical protein [Qipengyuania sp. G39]MDP4576290.1 hypothetical protein [Qipengyuania sp. G39]